MITAETSAYRIQSASRPVTDLPDPALIRITGPASEDTPCDEEDGEVLILPTRAEVVEDDAAFFDLVSDLVDLRWEKGLDCSKLRDIASERI